PDSPHTPSIASPAHASAAWAQNSPSNIAGTSGVTGSQGRTVAGAIDTELSLSGVMIPEEKQSPSQLSGASYGVTAAIGPMSHSGRSVAVTPEGSTQTGSEHWQGGHSCE